ncbi:MAG: outer membrane protein assembly factor BamD [Telmatospirillum sp.]|nr:outer membrane protein assembly factor BamD [Telmatospirillum sp.]
MPRRRPIRTFLAVALFGVALAACGEKEEVYVEKPVEELYNSAVNAMASGNYIRAAKQFDEVERQHPYSVWATRAQLQGAYAHYQNNKYDDAIVALDRFIQLNPSNRDVAYAYYLKALCYYEQITDVARDARMTEDALQSLQEVVRRFPDSTYARDARVKIDLTYDHLAGKEMEVGRFYQRRNQMLAAINRFRTVVEKFQTTSHVPEALHRLVESYMSLGLVDEARRTTAVLGHNYPGSEWYRDSFALVGTGEMPKDERPGMVNRTLNALNPINLF